MKKKKAKPDVDREAFTIAEFCQSIGISIAFFYKLDAAELPAQIRLGSRVLITREARDEWLKRKQELDGT